MDCCDELGQNFDVVRADVQLYSFFGALHWVPG